MHLYSRYSAVPTIHNATAAYMRERAADDPRFSEYGIDKYGVWRKGHSLRLIRSGAASLLTPDAEALSKAFGGLPIYPTYSMSEQVSEECVRAEVSRSAAQFLCFHRNRCPSLSLLLAREIP